MAYSNIIELRACMADCLAYCDKHQDLEFVGFHHPRLIHAHQSFEEAIKKSDRFFKVYTDSNIADKQAWKAASVSLRKLQKNLERYEVSGFPSEIILYWDTDVFRGHAQRMIDWLAKHEEAYPGMSDDATEFRRLCEGAESARVTRDNAIAEYARQAQFRAAAFGTLSTFLTEFRRSSKRNLGKSNSEYQAIRWPFGLAPDRPILI